MADTAQNFANHSKYDPPFHFLLVPLMGVNIVAAIIHLVRHPGLGSTWLLVLAIAALVAIGRIRFYALRVQDRVIRLEERLRLKELLPPSLQPRVPELTEGQLIALRFASDAEVPDLAAKALEANLKPAQIKQSVRLWRPDYWRV